MVSDSVSDALTRIKNGYMARKSSVVIPYSKLVVAVCEVLAKEGYLLKTEQVDGVKGGFKQVMVTLKYDKKAPVLTDVKRISKPGLRVYEGHKSLPWVLNGLGIALISTPKGIMTDRQARKLSLGGEVLAFVW